MGLRITNNIQSLRAQFALSSNSSKLEKTLTRLTTGLRINSPSDDVVGLTKAETLRTQIKGMNQARSNVTNLMNVMQVGEGYLSKLTDIAQELRATAVQAVDGTLGPKERAALDDYFVDMVAEFERLSSGASFNTINLLDGSFLNEVVQIGPDQGDTISISIEDTRTSAIGQVAVFTAEIRTSVSTNAVASSAFAGPNVGMLINGEVVPLTAYVDDGVSYLDADESAIAYVRAINSISGLTGVTATVLENVFTIDYSAGNAFESNQHLLINGYTVKDSPLTVSAGDDAGASSLVDYINNATSRTGVRAEIDDVNDEIRLIAEDGRNIHLQFSDDGDLSGSYNVLGITGAATNTQVNQRGTFRIQSDEDFDIDNAENEFTAGVNQNVVVDATTALSNAEISTSEQATVALWIVDNVITQLQIRRAAIGSAMTRLEGAQGEMVRRIENTTASESFIRDSDMAVETAELTKYQILQQAGVTVLAQANSSPQVLLQLLQQ